jgi:signal transduction histidine kinase
VTGIRELLVPRPPLGLPRRTIRLRLTIIYASLFLASGAGLLAFTYVLVRQADEVLYAERPDGSSVSIVGEEGTDGEPPANGVASRVDAQGRERGIELTPAQIAAQQLRDRELAERQRKAELRVLLEKSGIALGLMAALSILLGWLAAGRVLRPLRTLNDRAREITASDLHKRLALVGPDDELTQLADTFDDLLGRLEASFAAQRQFVANASHELRTPLARSRAIAEVALGDPDATTGSLRRSHRRVLAAGEQQERLIEALLTLARSERGLAQRDPFDLARVVESVVAARRPEADLRGLDLHATLEPAMTTGDPGLAERLVANLVDNALSHNHEEGALEVATSMQDGGAVLSVVNTGPRIPPDQIERLLQPFQRLAVDRTDHGEGIGLGLSIVNAIVTAHGASLTVTALALGGLRIEVGFPPVDATDGRSPDASGERTRRRRVFLWRRQKTLGSDDVPAQVARVN